MFKQAFRRYINNFRGFTREIWILTIITFINRAGTMVIPFLSKYLNEDLGFSLREVGWILACFGAGSFAGSWLGGKLSDKIGFYKIMVFSLFTSGLLFFAIERIKSLEGICIGVFILMAIADMFRPAMFVSINTYAKPENRTRALTLVRLAMNLGFMAGPTLGGLIILGMGYQGLFWVDGTTCIVAIVLFTILVKEKKKVTTPDSFVDDTEKPRTIFQDKAFLIFLFCSFVTATIFFQLFSTLPLYHRQQFGLTEFHTGLLLSLNGLLVLVFEMPLVGYLERKSIPKLKIIMWGALLMAISYYILLINAWIIILVVSMFIISFAEMFNFPFSNAFAMSRAPRGREGSYMAWYTMMFSLAHIVSGMTGMEITYKYGFNANWIFMGSAGILSTLILIWLHNKVLKENT